MAPERSYGRIAGLSVIGVMVVIVIAGWLLALPSDQYVLLPDDPHPADAVVSVGSGKPTPSRDGSGIYYLDVLVHRASVPESWLSRFEDGGTVVPAEAVVPPGGDSADLDRVDRLTFADSRTVAGVVALRALGRKVTVERTGVTFDGVDRSAPAWRAGLRPGMVITAIDGVAVLRRGRPAQADGGPQARRADPPDGRTTASARSSCAPRSRATRTTAAAPSSAFSACTTRRPARSCR